MRALGYVYVVGDETPTEKEQVDAIYDWAAKDGHLVVGQATDYSPLKAGRRPGLESALVRLEDGDADVLVVSHGHRLGGILDAGKVIARTMKAEEPRVVILDPPMSDVQVAALGFAGGLDAAWRHTGFRRTRRRAPAYDPAVVDRILADREAGLSMREIAAGLQLDRVPTANGGRWSMEVVRQILKDPERAKGGERQKA